MRLIDADALIKQIREKDHWLNHENGSLKDFVVTIANAPTVERQYFPPCEDCHKKMDDIRRAYDKAMARPKDEWIDYDNTFYKCPDCGYLLEKCCPQCQNKVILPKGGRQ